MALKPRSFRITLFGYKKGNSFLHRTNARVKLIALLLLSLSAPFILSRVPVIVLPALCFALAAFSFFCGFGFKEQFDQTRPLVFYLAFLYAVKTAPAVFRAAENFFRADTEGSARIASIFMPDRIFITSFFLIVILVQISLLFYKTTTGIELREAMRSIEQALRRVLRRLRFTKRLPESCGEAAFSRTFSVFLSFIPDVFETWNRVERSWAARAGKNGLQKIAALVPVFFSCCFYAASQKARALAARS